MTRTLIIGDVHGCIEELRLLLKKAQYNQGSDRLIFVGDLINRGPDSAAVLNLVVELEAETVMGNHERAFLRSMQTGWGEFDFREVKRQLDSELSRWQRWLAGLPYFIESDTFVVVHAGLTPNMSPSSCPERILTNIRTWDGTGDELNRSGDPPWFKFYSGPKVIVFGHWARLGKVDREHVIGLDTACVYGGELTAVSLPERRFYSVPAATKYYDPEKGS